jgi:hypothetical protein
MAADFDAKHAAAIISKGPLSLAVLKNARIRCFFPFLLTARRDWARNGGSPGTADVQSRSVWRANGHCKLVEEYTMRTSMKRIALAIAVLGLLAAMTESARASLVIVPNANISVEGDSNNGFPFNLSLFGDTNMRYQQVYDSSQFSTLGGPVLIHQILFRPDATTGAAFSSTLPDIQIDMSTTSATPATLSTTFANNVGADDRVVYARGSLSLSSAFTGPVGGPKDFDIVINLTTPFLYNPASGNLLMDVRNFGGGGTTQFDAVSSPNSVIERVWSIDVTATTGTYDATSAGLVTEFGFGPAVPEPSTLVAASFSVILCLGYALRRRMQSAA